VVEGEFTG
jgi:hypothetical protein